MPRPLDLRLISAARAQGINVEALRFEVEEIGLWHRTDGGYDRACRDAAARLSALYSMRPGAQAPASSALPDSPTDTALTG